MTCLARELAADAVEEQDEAFEKCVHFGLVQDARGDEQSARGRRWNERGVGVEDCLDIRVRAGIRR